MNNVASGHQSAILADHFVKKVNNHLDFQQKNTLSIILVLGKYYLV